MANELAPRQPGGVATVAAHRGELDPMEVAKYLGLSMKDPRAQAVMLVCYRYDLDPVLGHVDLYEGKVYVKVPGYLHLANRHPDYEGYRLVREWEDAKHCYAEVEVYRKGWRYPSVAKAKSAKNKPKKGGGTYFDDDADEKALSKALRRAIRRAFNIDWPEPETEVDPNAEKPAPPAAVTEVVRRVDTAVAEEHDGADVDEAEEIDGELDDDDIEVDPETGEILQEPAGPTAEDVAAAQAEATATRNRYDRRPPRADASREEWVGGWPPEPDDDEPPAGPAETRAPSGPAGPTGPLPDWVGKERAERAAHGRNVRAKRSEVGRRASPSAAAGPASDHPEPGEQGRLDDGGIHA